MPHRTAPPADWFGDRSAGPLVSPPTDAQPGVSAGRTAEQAVAIRPGTQVVDASSRGHGSNAEQSCAGLEPSSPEKRSPRTVYLDGTSSTATIRLPTAQATLIGPLPAVPRRHGFGLRKALVVTLFLAIFASSVSLWWFNTPTGAVKEQTSILLAAGRISGLMSGFILLMMVLSMARVPWIESWFGGRGLLDWHRAFGGTLIVLVLAHATLVVLAYARTARQPAVSQAWSMVTTLEGLAAAAAAVAILLILVGLLSVRFVRRGMPYGLWHAFHLSGYVVVVLALGHQLALGTAVIRPGPARWYWIGLHILVGLCLIWGRVLRPLWFNVRHRFHVIDVVDEAPGWVSIYIGGRRMNQVRVEAGQYVYCRFLASGCWWQAYPFSVSAAPNGEWLRVSVLAFDGHTSAIQELEVGARVLLSEAFGCFTASRRTTEKALLVTGGNGIAPVIALLEELPAEAVVLYWLPSEDSVVFRDELERLAEERQARIYFVYGPSGDYWPKRAFSTAGLRELVPDLAGRDVYLCGPRGLVRQALKTLRWLGMPRRQIHLDRSVLG